MAVTQREMLLGLGFETTAVTPDDITKPWRSSRFPALNTSFLCWQISALARRAVGCEGLLFSHGMCGVRGGGSRRLQLYHGTFAGLAEACRGRLSRLEHLISVRLNGLFEARSGRGAANVGVSAGVVREVAAHYGLPDATVIYNAVDLDHFSRLATPNRPFVGGFVGLYVGRLDYGKGRETVRRLGELLSSEHQLAVASAHIQGDAGWSGDRMRPLGRIEYPDLPEVYSGCDYVLCPSRYEGFGLTLVEAWASGRPVVTSNVGIVPELRGREETFDQMVVDDPDDAQAFATRVRLLREAPEIGRRQAAWGRQLVRERFSLETYRRAWEPMFS